MTLEQVDESHRFQILIDAIVDYAIYMIDVDGIVRSWNSGAVRMKGYTAEEVIGKLFSLFYMAKDRLRGLPQIGLKTSAKRVVLLLRAGVLRMAADFWPLWSSTRSVASKANSLVLSRSRATSPNVSDLRTNF